LCHCVITTYICATDITANHVRSIVINVNSLSSTTISVTDSSANCMIAKGIIAPVWLLRHWHYQISAHDISATIISATDNSVIDIISKA
jgi:hypothetical protein